MTKIKLIFAIFGDLLNPKLFTEIAKLSPTSTWFKGDANLFVHNFTPHLEKVVRYIEENKLKTKKDIVVEIVNDEKPAMSFDKNFMGLVVKMNGEIDIDLYFITS